MIYFIIIIIIGIVIYNIYIKKTNYKITTDFITFFEGGEGAGKTTILSHLGLLELKKRIWQNRIHFLSSKKACTKIYSNYPIYINKKYGYSYVLTNEILSWEKILEEGAIAICDEMGIFYPMETKKSSDKDIFTMTYLRHIMDEDPRGNHARIFASSQSMDEVNKTFRRKCNKCYELTGMRKTFGINKAKVNIMEIYLSENIQNQYMDTSEFKNNVYKFRYPKGHFSSKYAKDFKNIKNLEYVSKSYKNLLEYYGYKFGDKWRELDIKL